MCDIQRMNEGCADIGVKVSRQAAKPGVYGIDAFADRDKAKAV